MLNKKEGFYNYRFIIINISGVNQNTKLVAILLSIFFTFIEATSLISKQ